MAERYHRGSTTDRTLTTHPAFMMAILGVGVAVIIGIAVWAVEGGKSDYDPATTEMTAESMAQDGETIEEMSGEAVSPEDTADLTTPVPDSQPEEDLSEMSAEDAAVAEGGPQEEEAPAESGTDLDTSVVVDPDAGTNDGPEPDGGAAPFNPTPSGPEGSDGDPLTTQ